MTVMTKINIHEAKTHLSRYAKKPYGLGWSFMESSTSDWATRKSGICKSSPTSIAIPSTAS